MIYILLSVTGLKTLSALGLNNTDDEFLKGKYIVLQGGGCHYSYPKGNPVESLIQPLPPALAQVGNTLRGILWMRKSQIK